MIWTGFRSPWTTSAGRLFDGVASLLGLRHRVEHEGEAAMALEFAADQAAWAGTGSRWWPRPGWNGAAGRGLGAGAGRAAGRPGGGACPRPCVASRFHAGLVAAVVAVAERVGAERVALTGGCFQNRCSRRVWPRRCGARGFRPLLHRRVPANDGGLALGQVAVAAAVLLSQGGR
jgi:hydrogenase maturation protein HypF